MFSAKGDKEKFVIQNFFKRKNYLKKKKKKDKKVTLLVFYHSSVGKSFLCGFSNHAPAYY